MYHYISLGISYLCGVVRPSGVVSGDVTALCSNGELLMSGGIDAKIAHYSRLRGSREEKNPEPSGWYKQWGF